MSRGMWKALRAFGLNLKHWAEDHPVAASVLAQTLVVGLVIVVGLLLAHARGCELAAIGEETMGGCGGLGKTTSRGSDVDVTGCAKAPRRDSVPVRPCAAISRGRTLLAIKAYDGLGQSGPEAESGQPPILLHLEAVAVPRVEGPLAVPGGSMTVWPPSQSPTSNLREVGPAGFELEPGAGRCGVGKAGGLLSVPTELRRSALAGAEQQTRRVFNGTQESGPCPASGLVMEMGGCGVDRATHPRCELTGGSSDSPSAKEAAGDGAWGRGHPSCQDNSGQPPISLQAVAPAGLGQCRECPLPSAPTADGLGGPRFSPAVRRALDLLRMYESVNGTRMVGDGGRACGWLQQHRDHWEVGCRMLGVHWPWPADTADLAKCEAVAEANWRRYAPEAIAAGNVEELVRSFRLPSAPHQADNDVYWAKVNGQ